MLPAMGSKSLQFQLRGISCRMGPSVGRWGLEVVSYVASDLLEVYCFNNNKKKKEKVLTRILFAVGGFSIMFLFTIFGPFSKEIVDFR